MVTHAAGAVASAAVIRGWEGRMAGLPEEHFSRKPTTQTQATAADVERVAALIAEREVKAVFVESAVSPQLRSGSRPRP
jgi:hypothetical protein